MEAPGRVILRPGGDYEVTAVVEAEPGENFRADLVVEQFSDNQIGVTVSSRLLRCAWWMQ